MLDYRIEGGMVGRAFKTQLRAEQVPLGCFISRVGFFECAPSTFAIQTVLIERQRVQFAPFGTKKVAAIDVDGAGEPIDRSG